jgi:hypothetical protein
MGRRVVCAVPRGAAAGRRIVGRPLWATQGVRHRRGDLRSGVAGLRRVTRRAAVDRRTRRARRWRGAAGAGQSGVDQRHLRAKRARPRDRHLVWRERRHRRIGPGARRLSGGPLLLGLGVSDQRAVRTRGAGHHVAPCAGEPQPASAAGARRARRAAGHARPRRRCVCLHRSADAALERTGGVGGTDRRCCRLGGLRHHRVVFLFCGSSSQRGAAPPPRCCRWPCSATATSAAPTC